MVPDGPCQAWQEILSRMSPQLRRDTYREVNVHWVKKARVESRDTDGDGSRRMGGKIWLVLQSYTADIASFGNIWE